MIIVCPCDQKSFNIDDKLIPKEGRLVKCGVCNHTWFFKPTKNIENKQAAATPDTTINKEENREFIRVKQNTENVKPKVDKSKADKKYLPVIKKEKSENFTKLFLVFLIMLLLKQFSDVDPHLMCFLSRKFLYYNPEEVPL